MSDFASAAMVKVLQAGAKRLGMSLTLNESPSGATVPLASKREVIEQVVRQRGLGDLLRLGQGLLDVKQDPTLTLLLFTGQPLATMRAWLRLERFVHSRHRIVQTIHSEQKLEHRHVSLTSGAVPSPFEDLVVLGVLIALLQRCGVEGIEARSIDNAPLWPLPQDAHVSIKQVVDRGVSAHWVLNWSSVHGPKSVSIEPSILIVQSTRIDEACVSWLASRLSDDTSVDTLAQAMGISRRSLQRRLGEFGVKYVDLLGRARAQHAAQMLVSSKQALAHIGFACGYSDQAHFSRDFKRRLGLTPAQFRDQRDRATLPQ